MRHEDQAKRLFVRSVVHWKIVRAFEMMEPHIELHESKFPVAYELTMDQLREVMEARVASWVNEGLF